MCFRRPRSDGRIWTLSALPQCTVPPVRSGPMARTNVRRYSHQYHFLRRGIIRARLLVLAEPVSGDLAAVWFLSGTVSVDTQPSILPSIDHISLAHVSRPRNERRGQRIRILGQSYPVFEFKFSRTRVCRSQSTGGIYGAPARISCKRPDVPAAFECGRSHRFRQSAIMRAQNSALSIQHSDTLPPLDVIHAEDDLTGSVRALDTEQATDR